MKKITSIMIVILMMSTSANSASVVEYKGSRFSDVWDQLVSDSYELPKNEVSFSSLFSWGKDLIKRAAARTLSDRSDVRKQFRKLAHPNGVCLKGQWTIDQESAYSGYFKKGSKALIIARASTAMTETRRGGYRPFGFAGKIFPVTDVDHENKVKTANFFMVDDLGGTMASHYTDVAMTNEPPVTKTMAVIKNILYAGRLLLAFKNADSNPGVRQVYEISELGEDNLQGIITPKWMQIKAASGQTIDESDFRDELNADNYKGALKFEIAVASTVLSTGKRDWKTIGNIKFNSSVVSNSCDHRLHFHHPQWKSDLVHSKK